MSLSCIIQYKYAIAGPERQAITSATPVLVTGLSITITPQYADSIIFIRANVLGSHTHVTSFGIYKDGSPTVSTGVEVNTNYSNMQGTTYKGTNSTDFIEDFPLMHYETSGSTTARTYGIYGLASWSTTDYALYINNRVSNDMAGISFMEVMEVRN